MFLLRTSSSGASTGAGLESLSLIDGERIAQLPRRRFSSPLFCDRSSFCGVTAESELILGPTQDVSWCVRIGRADAGSHPLVGIDGILYQSNGRIMRRSRTVGDEPTVWFMFDSDVAPHSPMVLHARRVYVSTGDGGLLCLGKDVAE